MTWLFHNTQKDYEPGVVENPNAMRLPEEYELVYNDELPQLAEKNERPIHLRSKYPSGSNRDVRSGRLESSSTTSSTTPSSTSTSQPLSAQSPLSLWDLELDNEAQEQAADAAAAAAVTSSTRQSQYRRRKRQRRNEPATASSSSNSASTTSNNAGDDSTVDAPAEDWYLASISSTGVLLKALGNVSSSLNFAFVLNIRESEVYPPLFSPQDLSCVEEKISAYKST